MNSHPFYRVMRAVLAAVVLITLLAGVRAVSGQAPAEAEAIERANLRAGPGIDFPLVGEIVKGTRHPVVGRAARFPWLLIQTPAGPGWVFQDLVRLTGDLTAVPFTEAVVGATPTAPPPPQPTAPPADPSAPAAPTPTLPPPAPTAAAAVFAEAQDFSNVRFGPGTDYPVIATIQRGELYAVLRRHASLPWVEIALATVAGGRGWVFRDTLTITGDLNSVEATSLTVFGFPTLTATPLMVVTSVPPYLATPISRSNALLAPLAESIYSFLLGRGFVPGTVKQGSAFLMDLQTGESFSLNPGVAYSGVSLMKVPVLVAFFRKIATAPTLEQAQRLAEMIICSENLSSNRILRILGDGDTYQGALYVTETMQKLGLRDTFIVREFFTGVRVAGPTPTEPPFNPPTITANASQTNADPSNRTTPADLGWLMAGIYQCALDGSGPLTTTFPNEITQDDCRRMARVLRANKIGSLTESGVPSGIPVLHKHGWTDDTHGDTAIIMTPGGDYVLVVMLYNRRWLNYDDSFPTIAEISRAVYNAYNPSAPLGQINLQPIPLCSFDTISAGDPALMTDLTASIPGPLK